MSAPAADRAAGTLAHETGMLERIARGDPLPEVLADIASFIEERGDGAVASILLLDRAERRLRHGAAPSLPTSYTDAIDGIEIGPDVGSCGAAAFHVERVVAADIATDPRWASHRHVAEEHGLAACWATPILSSGGAVLGTLAVYYREPQPPVPEHEELVAVATHVAAIAIERWTAFADLARSRDFYLNLLADFPALVWRTDPSGHCEYVNRTWVEVTGFDLERSAGEGWIDAVHAEDRDRYRRAIEAAFVTRSSFELEHRVVQAGGHHRWVSAFGRPLHDPHGTFIGMIGACYDIEDRRRAQEAIGRQTALLENSNDSIGIAGLDGRVVYLNAAGRRLVGIDVDDVQGSAVESYFTPETWTMLRDRALHRVFSRGQWRGEGYLRHHVTEDAIPVEMSVFVIREAGTGEPAWIGTIQRDVSEKRAAAATEAELAGIVTSSVDAIVSVTLDGIIRSWNPAAEALFGYRADEVLGRHVAMLVPEDDDGGAEEQQDTMRRVLAGDPVRQLETTRRTKDGRTIPVSITLAPVRDGTGVVSGWSGVVHDLSDRELLEGQRRIAHDLQHSLLPRIPAQVHGAQLAARYLPGGVGIDVGGDWYDAIELPAGRVAVVIGDVVGRGTRAAATMGQLRSALRAYALDGFGPAEVLARLNRYAHASGDSAMSLFTTVWYGELHAPTGTLRHASAGHLPAMVVDRHHATRLLEGATGLPIGVSQGAAYTDRTLALAPGSTLLLYTDGLIERRGTAIDVGLQRLRRVAAESDDPEGLIEHLVTTLLTEDGDDDTALLAVRPGAMAD